MKRTLLFFITLFGMTIMHAEEYTYLTFVEQDGTKTSLTAVGLSLSFNGENLTASNAYTGESKEIALVSLASMNFSYDDESTGIRNIQADDIVSIDQADAIYTLQGQQLPSGRQLPKGIYIIRKGNVTKKLQVR